LVGGAPPTNIKRNLRTAVSAYRVDASRIVGRASVASVRFAVRDSPAQAKRAVSDWPTRIGG
jgi:hypothetical protein